MNITINARSAVMNKKMVVIFALLISLIGCATVGPPPQYVQRLVKEIPKSEGDVRFYGEGVKVEGVRP